MIPACGEWFQWATTSADSLRLPAPGPRLEDMTAPTVTTQPVSGSRARDQLASAQPVGDAAVSPTLRAAAGYTWRIAVLLVAVYVAFVALARVQTVAIAVFVGLVVCAVLLPLTRLLSRRLPRPLAAGISLAVGALLVLSLMTYVGASAVSQSASLTSQSRTASPVSSTG